jgi:hypothetical protein
MLRLLVKAFRPGRPNALNGVTDTGSSGRERDRASLPARRAGPLDGALFRSGITSPGVGATGKRLDVFARGTYGTLHHRWTAYGSGFWSRWESLGGLVDSAPAAVASDGG